MENRTTWAIDPMHSEMLFKIKHLVISTVTGSFKKFQGTAITSGNDFNNAKVNFTIDVNSIDTNEPHRDEHLLSSDFFESAAYPQIKFQSTSFTKESEGDYKMTGNLTIKEVTKPVVLNVEYGGSEKDMYGNIKHGFEITGNINRKDFGMSYNALTEAGGLTLGEEVKVIANIQVARLVEKEMAVEI
ncbi:MAG: YceI family protein [Ginsengibacter sp.]